MCYRVKYAEKKRNVLYVRKIALEGPFKFAAISREIFLLLINVNVRVRKDALTTFVTNPLIYICERKNLTGTRSECRSVTMKASDMLKRVIFRSKTIFFCVQL